MRNRRIVASIMAVAMMMAACGGSGGGDDTPAAEPVDVDALALSGEAEAGLATYRAKCASCHGADLSGRTGPALGPGSKAAGKPSADLRAKIVNGGEGMPSWGGLLDDAEIDGLVAFLLAAQGR